MIEKLTVENCKSFGDTTEIELGKNEVDKIGFSHFLAARIDNCGVSTSQ